MSYRTVPLSTMRGSVNVPQRVAPDTVLTLDSPATAALTDFTRECPSACVGDLIETSRSAPRSSLIEPHVAHSSSFTGDEHERSP